MLLSDLFTVFTGSVVLLSTSPEFGESHKIRT